MGDSYRGVVGAVPYAFRRSESWLFRAYVAVSTPVAAVVALLFGFALVKLIGETAAVRGGSLTLSRSFFAVVGLLAVAPMLMPTLFVARRHRTGRRVHRRYDALLALAGFLFLLALYAGTIAAIPETYQFGDQTVARPVPTGALAPVVALLYAIPPVAAPLVPLAAAVGVYLVHRVTSRRGDAAATTE